MRSVGNGIPALAFFALAAVAPVRAAADDSPDVARVEAPSIALVLVIDRSGSMSGAKLLEATGAVMAAVKTLPKGARAAVVAFDARASVAAPMRRLCRDR